jgi:hypothetical protein
VLAVPGRSSHDGLLAGITTAERLDATEVATLDRRHFSVVRPRHEVAFQLLP